MLRVIDAVFFLTSSSLSYYDGWIGVINSVPRRDSLFCAYCWCFWSKSLKPCIFRVLSRFMWRGLGSWESVLLRT